MLFSPSAITVPLSLFFILRNHSLLLLFCVSYTPSSCLQGGPFKCGFTDSGGTFASAKFDATDIAHLLPISPPGIFSTQHLSVIWCGG
ncbi:hypothetical protein EDD18DRAFT_530054 [Armillaria luteobubalina]|uniref:Secreted protein n=1 Tax=Armillaria luteobubalina TaxID=153913 RepID=A0AA39PXR5_9AGAR|nr:hypothetical protein EDD18DRAFT_530054 [Armillaria luteobubalina]